MREKVVVLDTMPMRWRSPSGSSRNTTGRPAGCRRYRSHTVGSGCAVASITRARRSDHGHCAAGGGLDIDAVQHLRPAESL